MNNEIPKKKGKPGQLTFRRITAAVIVGLLCSVFIWVITPFNNLILHLGSICGSYLPIGALFVFMLLIFAVNPFLKLIGKPEFRLNTSQLALILGILLVASVIPGQGLLRQLPYSLAETCRRVSNERQLAEAYKKDPPASALFPDKLEYKGNVQASEQMQIELLPGNSIPWGSWFKPLLSWGVLIMVMGLMTVGMAIIVLPQWRYRERLAFPLVEVQEALIEQPDKGRYLAPVYRRTSFWIGIAVVFLIYLFIGGNLHFPERIPKIPISWKLHGCFTQEPWWYLASWIKHGRIYFVFLAMAYFMPTRISFSVWFTALAYGIFVMVSYAYFPPFDESGTISDHRAGAMLVMTLFILWLGRERWIQIGKALFRRPDSEEEGRDRKAGFMFLAGTAGMLLWFMWAGADFLWALLFVGIGFMVSLVITRMIAETGVPFMRIYDCEPRVFIEMAPNHVPGPATILVSGLALLLFQYGSRVNVMTMATHSLAMDKDRPPSSQPRRGLLLVAVLMIGLAVSGAAHLYFAYHHSVSLDGEDIPISPWGSARLDASHNLVIRTQQGTIPEPLRNRPLNIGFGIILAGFLQYMCMTFPKWPLHPVGIIMVATFYGKAACHSIFFGWLIKIILVRYGGSRLYRSAKPFFLGLIVGEVFAAVFWAVIPALLVLMGSVYERVLIQPI